MSPADSRFSTAWVAVGDEANWERGLDHGIWGLMRELEHHWDRAQPGDLVLFYCKAPVKKVFGAGVIRSKFRQTVPLWKEELEAGRCIWPFRFEFDPLYVLPLRSWRISGVPAERFGLPRHAGLNPVADLSKALEAYRLLARGFPVYGRKEADIPSILSEMGRMQRMIVEVGYPVDDFSIDVVWKRLVRSVPTFSFAVERRGDFSATLPALKHAHDLWNSKPFLITRPEEARKAQAMAEGVFHEFGPMVKILTTSQVMELYERKKAYISLEEEYGLR